MKKTKKDKLNIIDGKFTKKTKRKNIPVAPRRSSPEYIHNWNLILDTIDDSHIISSYQIALDLFCQALTDYKKTTKFLKENGDIYQTTNSDGITVSLARPEVEILSIYSEQVKICIGMFLLTPGSRTELNID